ncbi:hypothetical protein ACFOOL_12465 [Devosia honganensis]|uniref:Uncharacterized protein n=1 Tax=Devosia honganensis TaxID=1610527 RepID=A0ABV7X2N0_9HYPH
MLRASATEIPALGAKARLHHAAATIKAAQPIDHDTLLITIGADAPMLIA